MNTQAPRILVLGAGSIGRRHARNLLAEGVSVDISDPEPDRCVGVTGARPVLQDAVRYEEYDGVVIATPSVLHAGQTLAVLDTGVRVLVEKPLAVTVEEAQRVADADAGQVMVGYNLRFHPPVADLVKRVQGGDVGAMRSVRVWCGSYLPDWRPGVDYRTTYSAQRSLGGGILLDASHELDQLIWLLGHELQVIGSIVDRVGVLAIDVEDTVSAILRHADGTPVELSLDYLSRRYRRGIEIVGEQATMRLDWARAVLELEDAAGVHSEAVHVDIAESYVAEIRTFLGFIAGLESPPVDAGGGAAVVRLAEQIRSAAA